MPFQLPRYQAPDFDAPCSRQAPSVRTVPVEMDGVAPHGFRAASILLESFKVGGRWLLPEKGRRDRAPVPRGNRIGIVEFRRLRDRGSLSVTSIATDAQDFPIRLKNNPMEPCPESAAAGVRS